MTGPAVTDRRPITERIRDLLTAGAASRGATMPTLDELKDMLGIPPGDTTSDDEITSTMAATIAIVERYLGRGVVFGAEVQPFEPVDSRNARLMLYRFPVTEVRTVTVDGQPVTGWRVFPASGILEWRGGYGGGRGYGYCGCGPEPIITVDYSGGYADDAWPADLMDAILRAFFARWHATGDTGNTADMSTQGPITQIAVDGSSVMYGTPGVDAAEFGGKDWPAELQSVIPILEPYRQRVVTGV
jgi:hypothetical protein